ncbi:hypothetical protein CyaNS01_02827 [Cyanobium sp. NS01]|nr:hypothetical protein CyaNS01_02827 [Cyanobium sp. NS01]
MCPEAVFDQPGARQPQAALGVLKGLGIGLLPAEGLGVDAVGR